MGVEVDLSYPYITDHSCYWVLTAALILGLIDFQFFLQSDELPNSLEITSLCIWDLQSHFPFFAATALLCVIMLIQQDREIL